MKTLQRKIMRGIYYAYFLRLISLPGVLQGFMMLGVLIALTHFVSLGNVIQNLSHVEVGRVGQFFMNALRTTEIWTYLLAGIFVFLMLSLRISFVPKHKANAYSLARI